MELTGRRVTPRAVILASRLTVVGVVLLPATVTSALLLILRGAMHNSAVPWIVGGPVGWFVLCWFALPVRARHRCAAEGSGAASDADAEGRGVR